MISRQPQKADAPGPGLANTGGDKLVLRDAKGVYYSMA